MKITLDKLLNIGYLIVALSPIASKYYYNNYGEPNYLYDITSIYYSDTKDIILEIDNISSKILNNIKIDISGSEVSKIKTNHYLSYKIEKSTSGYSNYLITLNDILPSKQYVIVINELNRNSKLKISNKIEKRLESYPYYIEKANNYTFSIVIAILYSIVFTINYFVIKKLDKKWKEDIEIINQKSVDEKKAAISDLKNEVEQTKIDLKEIKNKTIEQESRFRKQKIIWLSRIRDYKKELNFWKNVISKLLYSKSIEPEAIFLETTKALKTFGTLDNNEELDTIEYLAKIINYEDKNKIE